MLVTVKSFDDAIATVAGMTYGLYHQTQESLTVLSLTRDGWNYYFIADKKYQCHFNSRMSNNAVVEIIAQHGCRCYIPRLCVQSKTGIAQLLKEEYCERKIDKSKLHTPPDGWIGWFYIPPTPVNV